MIGVVNGISYKPYKAINSLSFGVAQGDTAAEDAKKGAMPPLPDNFYTNISKNSANNAIRNALYRSKGREEKNGKLSLASSLTYSAGAVFFIASVIGDMVKSLKEVNTSILKAFAPSNLFKNFPLKAGVALMLVGLGINMYNNLDAKRTAKERGVKDNRGITTTPELQRLEKETEELEKKKNAELTKIYSAEYDANMAIYQKVLADAPVGYFSLGKPAA